MRRPARPATLTPLRPARRLPRVGSRIAAILVMGALVTSGCSTSSSGAAGADPTASTELKAEGVGAPDSSSDASSSTAAPLYVDGEVRSGDNDLGDEGSSAVLDYWTDEQMAEAIPAEVPETDEEVRAEIENREALEKDGPEVVSDPVEGTDTTSDRKATDVTNFSRTNGKVFYRNATDGKNYVCSGSAVNSASQRLVATAAHCVHGGPGGAWHQNWIFVPGYDNGDRPYGSFQGAGFRTFNNWIDFGPTAQGFASDVAFVTTFDNADGKTVVDTVGGHGLTTGGSTFAYDVNVFGYPANIDDGQNMMACWGQSSMTAIDQEPFSGISGCGFGGGASGGPWLTGYDDATGLGKLKSVSSWVPMNSVETINGPFFGTSVRTLFELADTDWGSWG
ncbi:hypothetical protein [Kineosporia sp. NBRC 101731]|uniref:trypsin-like serine peptidase n=1 Tax=Kineosporia sp. NBRC 101731 TaxID=3032199 RepID=UPI0024A2FE98|nr:hypothetical protein [Kineosporia sp. NBRC 101731]GLY33588.1 peptidase [Kineosporia sp. NBRC 101731]